MTQTLKDKVEYIETSDFDNIKWIREQDVKEAVLDVHRFLKHIHSEEFDENDIGYFKSKYEIDLSDCYKNSFDMNIILEKIFGDFKEE